MNNRRKLRAGLVASALTAPFSSFAQQPRKVWRVGFLAQFSGPNKYVEAFLEGLRNALWRPRPGAHRAAHRIHRQRIAEFVAQHRLAAIFGSRAFVDAGGLMPYGPSLPEIFRRAAYYVDRIFKGAKPADLPVEQPTVFKLVINMKTARALGLKILNSILVQASTVIE